MGWQDVVGGAARYSVEQGDCLEALRAMPDCSVDMVLGSPPYMDARTYGIGAQRDCLEWVAWMLDVTEQAHRVSRGPVFWVAAGVTRDRNYWPGCEGLLWEWWRRGGDCQLYRPCCWRRVGIPGSGGDDYLRADWEYVLCFKHAGPLPWSDNTAMGHAPKWAPGGAMSHRVQSGNRVNTDRWGGFGDKGKPKGGRRPGGSLRSNEPPTAHCEKREHTKKMYARNPDGSRDESEAYDPPAVANPGNVLDVPVGGGRMGSPLAHDNEAPYPEGVPEFFVRSFCPPGGVCLDCFSGSGTTGAVAVRWGRRFVGFDLRQSQVELSLKRIEGETPCSLFV